MFLSAVRAKKRVYKYQSIPGNLIEVQLIKYMNVQGKDIYKCKTI